MKLNSLHRYSGAVIQENTKSDHRLEDTKSVREVSGEVSGVSRGKTHADYWLKRVFRQSYSVEGGRRESGAFSVKIQFVSKRESFPLNTANRSEAAKKAKLIWVSLVANGWEKTMVAYKPQAVFVPPTFVTVGDYLDFLQKHKTDAWTPVFHQQATNHMRHHFESDTWVPLILNSAKITSGSIRLVENVKLNPPEAAKFLVDSRYLYST